MKKIDYKKGISTATVLVSLALAFLVALYFIGASVEKEEDRITQSASAVATESSGQEDTAPAESITIDENFADGTPKIIKDFYLANTLNYAFPKETKVGWVESVGEFLNGETYEGFSVKSVGPISNKDDLTRAFLEARGFIYNPENSRKDDSYIVEGFASNNVSCLLRNQKAGRNAVRQSLSCSEI